MIIESISALIRYGFAIPVSTRKVIKFSEYSLVTIKIFTFYNIHCDLCKKNKRFTYYYWNFVYTHGIFCNEACLNSYILIMQSSNKDEQIAFTINIAKDENK